MTTETIHIVIREDGSRVVTRNIQGIGSAAENVANRGLATLKRALGGVVVAAGLNQLKQLADSYTNIQNRLRLTTTGQANLNAVFGELQAISGRTRSSLEANAELYSRIAVSAKDLGVSQSELLTFTERLNKAIKISGATTQEAEAGLIQLSQGMASGTLRGDELRSVLEQLPAVADVIAKSMGVTRGELRQLGFEGKISAETILKAFREVGPELDAKFAKTVPTIAEGFVMLRNQLVSTVGALDEAASGSSSLGEAFAFISKGIGTVTPHVVDFIRAIKGTLDPMDELNEYAKVFATIFTVVGSVMQTVAKIVGTTVVGAFKTLGRIIGAQGAAMVALFRGDFIEAGMILKDAFFDTVSGVSEGTKDLYADLVGDTTDTIDKLAQIWDKGKRTIQDRSKLEVGVVSTESTTPTLPGPNESELAKREKALERMRNKLKGVLNEIAPLDGAIIKLNQSEKILADSVKAGLITKDQETHYLALLDEYYNQLLDPIGQLNKEIDEQARLLGMSAKAREVEAQVLDASKALLTQGIILTQEETTALREKFTALQNLNTMTQLQDQLLADSVDQRQGFIDQLTAINALMANTDSGFNKADAGGAVSNLVATMGLDPTLLQANIDHILGQTQTMYDQIKALRDANVISEQEAAGLRAQAWVQSQQVQLQTASNFFGDLSQLQRSESSKMAKVGKAAAIAQAIINTYQSATAAYASLAGIPYIGPALGVAAAAAAVAAGMANVQAIRKQPVGGYMTGGYTGDIGRTQVAGAVHGREYVMDASTTSRIGRRNLDALRTGDATVATRGGGEGGGPGVVNVSIENYGSGKEFEVQQLSPTDVRIIARDEAEKIVTKRVPEMVASDIRNPNSNISKSLNSNTQAGRRR